MNLSDADIRRFWSKVNLPDKNGCMNWTAGQDGRGYGQFWIDGSSTTAHRVSLIIAEGLPISDELESAHGCLNHICVAPEHLSWKTHAENMKDRVRDNTLSRGENRYNARLTQMLVNEMRARYREGNISQRQIAKEYGISKSHAANILTNKKWRDE